MRVGGGGCRGAWGDRPIFPRVIRHACEDPFVARWRAIRGGMRKRESLETRERAALGWTRGQGGRSHGGSARFYDGPCERCDASAGGALGRCHYAKIRSQYLIQDNHNDYTSGPPFSRGRYLPTLVYTRVHPAAWNTLLPSRWTLSCILLDLPPPPRGMVRACLELGSAPMPRGGPRGLVAKMQRCLS